MKKMRLLTFMQIAETKKEITFDTIKQELQLDEDSVESFIIDGELRLRRDGSECKNVVSSSENETGSSEDRPVEPEGVSVVNHASDIR